MARHSSPFAFAACVTAIVLGGNPAAAETPLDIDGCTAKRQVSLDERIAACTTLLASGRWSGKDLVWVYSHRGSAYRSKND